MNLEIETLQSIIEYCVAIQDDRQFFGDDMEHYLKDKRYQRSVTFSLFQIGEVTKNLRKNYGSRYDTIFGRRSRVLEM